jgi:hypothetical protein
MIPALLSNNVDAGRSLQNLWSVLQSLIMFRSMMTKKLFALDGGGYRMSSRIFWSVAGAYYFTSFVKIEIDYALWSESERLMTATLAVCLVIILSLFAKDNE